MAAVSYASAARGPWRPYRLVCERWSAVTSTGSLATG
jgi:hypothetical protein